MRKCPGSKSSATRTAQGIEAAANDLAAVIIGLRLAAEYYRCGDYTAALDAFDGAQNYMCMPLHLLRGIR